MNKKNAKITLNISLSIFLIGALLVIYNGGKIKAETGPRIFVSEDVLNIGDVKQEKIKLRTYKVKNGYEHYLETNNFFHRTELKLTGFEDRVDFCKSDVIVDGMKNGKIVCVIGTVGAHSQNINLVRVTNEGLVKMFFYEDKNKSYNLTSDVPNIKVTDYNSDKVIDVMKKDRDYDKNPLMDSIEKHYFGSAGGFVFDKSETLELKYN